MDALAGMLLYSAGVMRPAARENFRANPAIPELEASWPPKEAAAVAEVVDRAKAIAGKDPLYRMERFVQRHVAEEMMARNVVMAEERRDDHERLAALPRQGAGGTLELDPSTPVPDYYEDVFYHLAPHGGHEYDLGGKGGGIVTVFKYGGFAAVPLHSDIGAHRVMTARQLPHKPYKRILEMGCGGVFTLNAVHQVFPEAELIGCDLAALYLETGHEIAEKMGLKVHLKQKDARATGEADASIDAIVTYALHHEAPVAVNVEIFKEMFRVLAPGGEVVINDPPPFRAVGLFDAVILEWDNDNREEPYFRETCLANWDEELKAVGFEDVHSYALGPSGYPWITRATKPG